MIDRGDILPAINAQYLGLHCRALVIVWSIRLTAWLQNSKKRAERSERLMYEQSHRDYLRSGYLHHRLPAGLLIITVITPLPTKPIPENWSWRTRQLLTCRCVSGAAALDAKYTKELADAKAENDALRDDAAAGRRRLHIVSPSVMREATTASGADNAASPRLADTAERDYFTLREADYAKTTGRNPEVY